MLLVAFSLQLHAETHRQVKIYFSDKSEVMDLARQGLIFGHAHHEKSAEGFSLIAVLNEAEYSVLQTSGTVYDVLIADVEAEYESRPVLSEQERSSIEQNSMVSGFDFGSMGGFYTLDEVVAELDIMRSLYPNLITAKQSLGTTHEGRDIWSVKISDNPDIDETEPEALYSSLHHCREPAGMMSVIYFMYYLLENYPADPEVKYLVENRELYFVPVVNPDGYAYNQQTNPNGGGNWRKNRLNNGDGSFGVDLNRNYGYQWGYDNSGSSPNTNSNTYRGTSAFSEPETQAMRDFCNTHEFRAALNYHTFSNLLIYPFGYEVNVLTPDSAVFDAYGADMTQFNNYSAGTAINTVGYTANGNSDDWMYGEQTTKNKILAMTPEVGGFADGFWPAQNRIFPLVEENLYPNLYLAWIVGGLVSGTSIDITELGDGNGYVDPGEQAEVVFNMKNLGQGEAANVTFALTTADPNVTISGSGGGPFTISSQAEQQTDVFTVQVDANAAAGSEVFADLSIIVDGVPREERHRLFIVGTPVIAFGNDAEEGTTNWTTGQSWGTTSNTFVSPSHSFADTPTGDYPANANNTFRYSNSIDLSGVNAAFLEFQTRWEIESSYDFARVQISTNGSSWTSLVGSYTKEGSGQGVQTPGEPGYDGSQLSWVKEVIDLSSYIGSTVFLRFNLSSDGGVEGDGWYLDDIAVTTYSDPLTGIEPITGVPTKIELNANYPNPFNPNTTISFGIPKAEQVTLTIFNVLGQPIRELVNNELAAGNYELNWDGRDSSGKQVSSGLYFYSLQSESQRLVRKMMLSR